MYHIFAKKILEQVKAPLPQIKWDQDDSHVKITLVCQKYRHVGSFFYHMLSRWLIPGKDLGISLYFSMDYEECTICEAAFKLQDSGDLLRAKHYFSFLEKEILLGIESPYLATKILEMKGLCLDEKAAMIHRRLASGMERFPKAFDYDLFEEMQQFLITSKEEFRAFRRAKELFRLIFTLYTARKWLMKEVAKDSSKRSLFLKFKPSLLNTPFGTKKVLSIYLGLNFLNDHEFFEKRHLVSALAHIMPDAPIVSSSYFTSEGEESIQAYYIEVEMDLPFVREEINDLKSRLSKEIQSRIEQLVAPVFMPRNEEEVMRNIVLLSHQLHFLKDIPQMFISFDEQTDSELCFTVIVVRLVGSDTPPIRELFRGSPLEERLSIERVKVVGKLRRKHPKEANVMRICLPAKQFLREDFSVDLLSARIQLVSEIEQVLGQVRDYNGGMILKQSENFSCLKKILGKEGEKHRLLLQNFFHSISPASFSSTLAPTQLKTLFSMLLESMEASREVAKPLSKKGKEGLFIMIKDHDPFLRQKIFTKIEPLNLPSNELCSVPMQIFDSSYLGILYLAQDLEKQARLLEVVDDLTFAENSSYL